MAHRTVLSAVVPGRGAKLILMGVVVVGDDVFLEVDVVASMPRRARSEEREESEDERERS